MAIFFVTLTVFLLAMVGMAVGAIIDRKPLKGSCGGIGARAAGDCDETARAGCEYCGRSDVEDEVTT